MKKLLLLFLNLLFFISYAQEPFITTWEVESDDLEITIPTLTPGYTYDYNVDFGDGTILTNQTGDVTHSYTNAGVYTVSISGVFPQFYGYELFSGFDQVNESEKLLSVEQWGDNQWLDMTRMFYGCLNLVVNANDTPNLSQATSMAQMFYAASSFNQNINDWDVSNITNINELFRRAVSFNQPLNNWDVSNVTSMFQIFRGAKNFNQNINNWDVSNVNSMAGAFDSTNSYNQPLNNWDVSNVYDMSYMFFDASSFNQPLNTWDVSNVIDYGFLSMFFDASSFNQDISDWNFQNGNLPGFLGYSGMQSYNYDLLLNRLLQLGTEINQSFVLGANGINFCDSFTRQALIDGGWSINDSGIADNCELNYIIGSALYDENSDGCNESDPFLSNYFLNVNNGSEQANFYVDSGGEYIIALPVGNYTINLNNLDNNFSASPSSQTVNLTGANEILEDFNFCISATQDFDDLAIDFFPLNDAIPGFETTYQLIYYNNGSQTVPNAQISFAYDEAFQSFVSATETPSENMLNSLTFDVSNVAPFTSEVIEIKLLNVVPPTLNGGEILSFTAQITPDDNDETVEDNTAIYDQTVVNSFDPNDKMVVQGDAIPDEAIGEFLDYRIRFQNVGTAHALNVVITDTISQKLDWSTFQIISSSHSYRVELNDQEEINFIFEDINLPYEELDEEGSNGYITYKIKPKSNVEIGDVIENTAYIFFDFNLPIITNTVSTAIVDNLSTTGFEKPEIKVYPNPVKNDLYLQVPEQIQINQLRLYNINGQQIKTFSNKTILSLDDLNSGFYILQINTNKGFYHKKLVKD